MRLVTAKKGVKNELPEIATADDWSDVGYVALGWVRCSYSYAHCHRCHGYTTTHSHASPTDGYTCATDSHANSTDSHASPADSYGYTTTHTHTSPADGHTYVSPTDGYTHTNPTDLNSYAHTDCRPHGRIHYAYTRRNLAVCAMEPWRSHTYVLAE
jgi:hypothetical protein